MYMPYTTNPTMPRIRMEAVALLRKGWSTREVARHFGFNQSAIVRWSQRSLRHRQSRILPTRSSRPRHSPRALPPRELRYDNALMSERRREVGGYLLSCLFLDQPVHCFLPRLKFTEFPLGEGFQCFVEDFG
jgi:transposase-like protein